MIPLRIKYFVIGAYSLSARGIPTSLDENFIIVKGNKKEIINKLFKLRMFPTEIKKDFIEVHREFKFGSYKIKISFYDGKVRANGKEIVLLPDSFENERIEVPSNKYPRIIGYFRVGKIEETYLFLLGHYKYIFEIMSYGKVNIDRFIKLLITNSLL